MTDTQTKPQPRLWTREGFTSDPWSHADAWPERPVNARIILPLSAFLALDPSFREANRESLGVLLAPAEPLDSLLPYLGQLGLVALAFPAFNDGRSYSKAALLRTTHGYTGTLRASGDVLIDQIPLMLRQGFDELEVSNPTALKRLEEGRLGGIEQRYQPSVDTSEAGERYAWRRLPG